MGVKYREELAVRLAGVTLETLEETPERVLKFVRGTGQNRVVRRQLQRRGYTKAVHEEFWRLLAKCSGISGASAEEDPTDPIVAAAVDELDPYDEEFFEITKASLVRKYDAQKDYLLKDIDPSTGMEAVLNVSLFLNRAHALETGEGREATRAQDQEVLKLLEVRGIKKELREYLAERVKVATSAEDVEEVNPEALEAADEAYVQALTDLRVWYDEWSSIARAVIKRRDHLMLLGLAHRRSPTKKKGEEREEPLVQ